MQLTLTHYKVTQHNSLLIWFLILALCLCWKHNTLDRKLELCMKKTNSEVGLHTKQQLYFHTQLQTWAGF